MGILARHTNHSSTKLAWFAAEAYQKGTIKHNYQVEKKLDKITPIQYILLTILLISSKVSYAT